mgnify:CR=1 FL=1
MGLQKSAMLTCYLYADKCCMILSSSWLFFSDPTYIFVWDNNTEGLYRVKAEHLVMINV